MRLHRQFVTVLVVLIGICAFADRALAHYNPALGRWMEQEPCRADYIDGCNLYQAYSSGPVVNVDPLGQYAASLIYQHVSSDEHKNYQVFTASCPACSIVSDVQVGYGTQMGEGSLEWDLYDQFFQQNGWDFLTFEENVMAPLHSDFGDIKDPGNANCNGAAVQIQVYMRTRLVGGGLEGWGYRLRHNYIPPEISLSLYARDTRVTYQCESCRH
jgi:hypothetical protein